MKPTQLSNDEARRIALAAQGFAAPRPPKVDKRALGKMVDRLGVIQIDSVNVLQRSHYMPAWSRLGAYDIGLLERMAYRAPRALFEYWGHEASLLPVELWPLFQWRMARAADHAWGMVKRMKNRKTILAAILEQVTERGPIGAGDLDVGVKKKGGWWEWSDAKRAVEWLFYTGALTTHSRKNFERLYDLPSRVLPDKIFRAPAVAEADARRALLARAGRALGVATEKDLRDYYRIRPLGVKEALAELVEDGTLEVVHIPHWGKTAYKHADAVLPKAIDPTRAALLSPFDSLVWERARTERLFAMRYRIEIYTPAEKRVHGYYVLPFLLGEHLVGRVDLKADRASRQLLVQSAHVESHAKPKDVAGSLAAELAALGNWLGLDGVTVKPSGALAKDLAAALP